MFGAEYITARSISDFEELTAAPHLGFIIDFVPLVSDFHWDLSFRPQLATICNFYKTGFSHPLSRARSLSLLLIVIIDLTSCVPIGVIVRRGFIFSLLISSAFWVKSITLPRGRGEAPFGIGRLWQGNEATFRGIIPIP